jgi:hypothetical protein
MLPLNRTLVLKTLIKHETLTFNDLAKVENLGIIPNEDHLQFLLDELNEDGHIHLMNGIVPSTYTITDSGIKEGTRLSNKV